MKILKRLKESQLWGNTHILAFLILLIGFSFKYPYLSILAILYFILIYKRFRQIRRHILICLISFITIFSIAYFKTTNLDITNNQIDCYVLSEKKSTESYKVYLVLTNREKVELYYYGTDEIHEGYFYTFYGKYQEFADKSYENDFDYQFYQKTNRIYLSFKANNSTLKQKGFSIYRVRSYLISYEERMLKEDTKPYILSLVFNQTDSELKSDTSKLGLSYLFAISGLHLMILFELINKLTKKISFLNYELITISILFLYLIVTGFPISLLRAWLFLLIRIILERFQFSYTKLDCLAITLIIFLYINPLLMFQNGFEMSFFVTFIFLFSDSFITKNKILNMYITTLIAQLSILPITISITNRFSVIGFLITPLELELFTGLIIPTSYIIAFCPLLSYLFNDLYKIINIINHSLASLRLFVIPIKSLSSIEIILYYFFFFSMLLLKQKKKTIGIFIFMMYLFIVNNVILLNPYNKITFLDVGQGDSIIIQFAHKKSCVVIDAFYGIDDYLLSEGISYIDAVFITHSHSDHIAELPKLINDFTIANIYISPYDDMVTIKEYTNNYNIISSDFKIKINDIDFYILGPINNDSSNLNNNSLVIKTTIYGKSFLFTGDMEFKEEKDLIEYYNDNLKSDVLKVGHHGSDTSSSKEFLEYVNCEYSVISCSIDNKYGFPAASTLSNLSDSIILITYDKKTISFYVKNDKFYYKTYK